MGRGKELAKNTGIIAIGKISTRLISFFLLPLYTAVLSTEEYGVVDVFNTYVRLLLPVVSLMVGQGAFRYLLASKEESDKKRIVSSSTFFVIILLVLSGVIYWGISFVWTNEYEIYLWWVLVSAVASDYVLQLARGFRQLKLYAIGGLVSSTVQIVMNVVFLTVFQSGPVGMFLATIMGNTTGFALLFLRLKIYKYIRFKAWNKGILKNVLQYSVPLVPNQLSIWILNSSDRFIVNLFMGVAANGILGVSHKFPEILSAVFNIFQLSWHEMGVVHYEDPDRDDYFTETFHQVFCLFAAGSVLLIAILPIIFNGLIDAEYSEAYYTVPIYVMATMFNMVVGFLGTIYIAIKKTHEISKTTIIAGVINVIVHVLLIQYIGLYAAAVSTWVAYLAVMIYRIIDTKKYVAIKYNKILLSVIFSMQLLISVLYYVDSLPVHILGIAFAGVFAVLINKRMIGQLFEEAKRKLRK